MIGQVGEMAAVALRGDPAEEAGVAPQGDGYESLHAAFNMSCFARDTGGSHRSARFYVALWPSQRKHKQHGLIAHLAQFRGQREPALGDLAEPRHDRNILLAADLEGHGWGIEARPTLYALVARR